MPILEPEPNDLSPDVQPIPIPQPDGEERNARLRRILGSVGSFFLGQGALQAINVVVGLYLVRVEY